MRNTTYRRLNILDLPSEIRKEIYRHLTVHESAINIATNSANSTNKVFHTSVKLVPGLPLLTFTNRSIYDEVKSVYFQENTFTFRRNALQSEALRYLARKHGRWLDQVTSVEISQYFYRRNSFRCELDFKVEITSGRLALTDLTEDLETDVSNAEDPSKSVSVKACLCEVTSLARRWKFSLIAFVEACADFEWTWQEQHARVVLCDFCGGLELTRTRPNPARKSIFIPQGVRDAR